MNIDSKLKEAQATYEKCSFEKAYYLYKELASQMPNDANILYLLGSIGIKLWGQSFNNVNLLESVNYFIDSINIAPSLDKLIELGSYYLSCCLIPEALACFNSAVNIDDESYEALHSLGYCYYLLKQYDKAENFFVYLIRSDMAKNQDYITLIKVLLSSNKIAEAFEVTKHYLNSNTPNDEIFYLIGMLFKKQGDYESAIQYFSRINADKKFVLQANKQLGCIFKELKDIDNAIKYFKNSFKENPEIFYELGLLYKGINTNKAIEYFREVIRINVYFEPAYRELADIISKKSLLSEYNKQLEGQISNEELFRIKASINTIKNMDKSNDTWLVFGSSPHIQQIKAKIPQLLEKYHSIGINHFPEFFPECEYWNYNDDFILNEVIIPNYNGQKVLMNRKNDFILNDIWKLVVKNNDEENTLYNSLKPIRPYYVYRAQDNTAFGQIRNYHLLGGDTTAITSINYATMMGAKKVILLGIDNNPNNNTYFYNAPTRYASCQCSEQIKEKVKALSKYSTILKANPDANFDIDFIDIDKLL